MATAGAGGPKTVGGYVNRLLRDIDLPELVREDHEPFKLDTQHNPRIGDGLSGLGAALQALSKQGISMKYDRIHRVLGEGNFVLVVSEGAFGGAHTSFYDLFRVDKGKLAEHWDVLETIPAREKWMNDNGKF